MPTFVTSLPVGAARLDAVGRAVHGVLLWDPSGPSPSEDPGSPAVTLRPGAAPGLQEVLTPCPGRGGAASPDGP